MAYKTMTPMYVLCLILYVSQMIYSSGSACVKFDFLNLSEDTVTHEENATLTLAFNMTPLQRCDSPFKLYFHNYTINVGKKGKETEIVGTTCQFRHINLTCVGTNYTDVACDCSNKTYRFTKKVDRADSGKWIWSAKPKGFVDSKNLIFNVTYPPLVKSLHMRDKADTEMSVVDEGDAVLIICFWDTGNPPFEARLVDNQGQELKSERISEQAIGQIRYRYDAVRCADTGTFRCEIPGHQQSKDIALRVKCPLDITLPQNEMDVIAGGSVVLKANIRSYTSNLTECTLTKTFRSGNARTTQQCNITDLTGSPPDLSLTIQLDNIQEEEDGEWTLYIANDKGDGQVDFKINVADCPLDITLPQNEMDVIAGGSVLLKANIRSYTSNLTKCTLTKTFRSGNARTTQQCKITDLTGSPPDLTLAIQLDDIQEKEDGEWTLYIANDKGDGQVDFKINVVVSTCL